MSARVTVEMSVGLTEPLRDALEAAVEFQGVKASTYARQAIAQKLVTDGFMSAPTLRTVQVGRGER